MELLCPVCGEKLNKVDRAWLCPNRHSFDIARQGYVNLLTVQQKHSLNPGDTREQVLSRRAFLEAGFYRPIVDALRDTARELNASGPLLDIGCGEGRILPGQILQAVDNGFVCGEGCGNILHGIAKGQGIVQFTLMHTANDQSHSKTAPFCTRTTQARHTSSQICTNQPARSPVMPPNSF